MAEQDGAYCHTCLVEGVVNRQRPFPVCAGERGIRVPFDHDDDSARRLDFHRLVQLRGDGAEEGVGPCGQFADRDDEGQLHLFVVEEQEPELMLDGAADEVRDSLLHETIRCQRLQPRLFIVGRYHPPIVGCHARPAGRQHPFGAELSSVTR